MQSNKIFGDVKYNTFRLVMTKSNRIVSNSHKQYNTFFPPQTAAFGRLCCFQNKFVYVIWLQNFIRNVT